MLADWSRTTFCITTSRKVSGSIHNSVTGIFYWHNPACHTRTLGVEAASKNTEYQEFFLRGKCGRCLGLTTLPLSCAECHDVWTSQPPGTFRVCPGLQLLFFTFRDFNETVGNIQWMLEFIITPLSRTALLVLSYQTIVITEIPHLKRVGRCRIVACVGGWELDLIVDYWEHRHLLGTSDFHTGQVISWRTEWVLTSEWPFTMNLKLLIK